MMEEAVDPHAFITKAIQNVTKLTKETISKMVSETNNVMDMIS